MSESAAPRFSILTAVYETEPEHLAECLASVDAQTEGSWEHVLVDDGSTRPGLDEVLAAHAEPGGRAVASVDRIAAELGSMATWLGLERVEVERSGDLSGPLRTAGRS